jgi:hypothetical protein
VNPIGTAQIDAVKHFVCVLSLLHARSLLEFVRSEVISGGAGGAITYDVGSPAKVTIARETNTTKAKAISLFILHGMMSCCLSVSAH